MEVNSKRTSRTKYTARKNAIKNMYKRLWISILSTLIMISMMAGSTYAWFTSTAVTNNNSIKSGVLAVELLMSETDLKEIVGEEHLDDYQKYIRQIDGEDHYLITGSDVVILNIRNMEPGQVHPFKLKVANAGQLAANYFVYFEIEKDDDGKSLSLTGLQTLEQDKLDSEDFLGFEFEEKDYTHDSDLANEGLLTNRDYETRYRVLKREQWDDSKIEGQKDIGGHLEDILEIYEGPDTDNIGNDDYCFGTITDIINEGSTGKYHGYLLPYSETLDEVTSLPTTKSVIITDGETTIETKENVCEYAEIDLFIYFPPADDNNLYEYASTKLKIGVSARQCEYEKDGLGIMIYDRQIGETE